jgi:hypothetical protein
MQNFCGETSWKTVTWTSEKEIKNIKMELRERQIVRMGGGWNWLRIVSSGGLWY